ncbi:MAG TPA: hypothetical protein PLD62_07790 [Candidatus Cloacimonadota bacterium]|nr:hypothetical protein [Candidatus Cloacimonadota bacterium]
MKKRIFFQVIVIMMILFIWNCLHLGYNYQNRLYEAELSDSPMILICSDLKPLQNLKTALDTTSIVQYTVLEKDSLIKRNLLETYQLNNAEALLGKFNVPSILKIYFRGVEFSAPQKRELETFLNTSYPEVIINYNDTFWQNSLEKIALLKKAYFYSNLFLAVFLLITIVFLRLHFEMKNHEYWRVFVRAGGKRKVRHLRFFLHSLWLCVVPVGLNFGAYFIAMRQHYLPVEMDIRYFPAEGIFVIFSVILSRIFIGKHF